MEGGFVKQRTLGGLGCVILGKGLVERGSEKGGSWGCFSKDGPELFTLNTREEVKHVVLVTGEGSTKVVCPISGLFSRGRSLERDLQGLNEGN